ncbi:hypothetical protein E2F43_18245 [Seongchinamella unica]|uniref:DUF4258 domain-containing protein n=1 Tax=Seongchinamella unica TaxID=2547392 RepID=A0A4V2ZWV0_9GAMM|nr:hypothetical protein [Seongchinamella unica]TDG11652.1 hypothetical protein E2F43_18245 [Seongchinamella unica]
MARTRHIQRRMSQRGIQGGMLDLVSQFGVEKGDLCYVNGKACADAVKELDRLRKLLIKMQEKGGIVLVRDGDVDITTYRLDSYTRH